MPQKIKFAHTNLIANDWKKLSRFYIDVFDCEPIYPEKKLEGEWIEKVTGIPHVKIDGIHLRLPGAADGPILEIFEFNTPSKNSSPVIDDPGFTHIAFEVENVENLLQKLIKHGGGTYGGLQEKKVEGVGILTVVYATDPEGNIVELMNWRKE
jgi:predicted enzyme related to lactoylglutathione lyase